MALSSSQSINQFRQFICFERGLNSLNGLRRTRIWLCVSILYKINQKYLIDVLYIPPSTVSWRAEQHEPWWHKMVRLALNSQLWVKVTRFT